MKLPRIIKTKEVVITPTMPYGNVKELLYDFAIDKNGGLHNVTYVFKCRGNKCIIAYLKSELDKI
jgi:hypothetical protein